MASTSVVRVAGQVLGSGPCQCRHWHVAVGGPRRPPGPLLLHAGAAAGGDVQSLQCLLAHWHPLHPAAVLLLRAGAVPPPGPARCSSPVTATACQPSPIAVAVVTRPRTLWRPSGRQLRMEQQVWSWTSSLLLMKFLF